MFYFRISASEKMIFIYLVSKSTMFSFRKHRGGKFWNIALGKQTNTSKHNTHHGDGAAGDGEQYRISRQQWWMGMGIYPLGCSLIPDENHPFNKNPLHGFRPQKPRSDNNVSTGLVLWYCLGRAAWCCLLCCAHCSLLWQLTIRRVLQFLH